MIRKIVALLVVGSAGFVVGGFLGLVSGFFIVMLLSQQAIGVLSAATTAITLAAAIFGRRWIAPGSPQGMFFPLAHCALSGFFLCVSMVVLMSGMQARISETTIYILVACSVIHAVAGVVLTLTGPELPELRIPTFRSPGGPES